MSKYFIYLDNVVRGPFTQETIANMLITGKISCTTPISGGSNTKWQPIADHAMFNNITAGKTDNKAVTHPRPESPNSTAECIFYCPSCQQKYSGDSSWLNRDVICVNCHEVFTARSDRTDSEVLSANAATEASTINSESPGTETFVNDWANNTGSIICPHCWLHFEREQLLYIASHPALTGDPVLGPDAMKRFAPVRFNALGQALDEMSQVASGAACPRCRLKIPMTLIDEKSFCFSLAGAPSSGKSYFLATLLHSLRKQLAGEFACSLIDVDPELNIVLNRYEETLFRPANLHEVAVLPKTQQTGEDFVNAVVLDDIPIHLPKPFVYELKHFNSHESANDCNIIFYDNAGEQFVPGNDNLTNPGTRHLACSDGIIFLFDPLNDALMRNVCDQQDPQLQCDDHVIDQPRLLSEMIARIRRHRNLNSRSKCTIPLVIAVGKYDSWSSLLSCNLENLPLLENTGTDLAALYQKNTVLDVSFKLREILMGFVPDLVNTAESFFERVIFIPFSSFGGHAQISQSGQLGVIPSALKPQWVEQPLLWLLAENDLLSTAPVPSSGNVLTGQVIDNFFVFKHPDNNNTIRLPKYYVSATVTINNRSYTLKQDHASSNKNSAAHIYMDQPDNDLWS